MVQDVRDHTLEDRMESFFLSETTKYLYLLFDTENFIHNSGNEATIHETDRGQCFLDAGNMLYLVLVYLGNNKDVVNAAFLCFETSKLWVLFMYIL